MHQVHFAGDLVKAVLHHRQRHRVDVIACPLGKIRDVHAAGGGQEDGEALVSDDGLHAFMEHCSKRVGEAYFRTPRNTIKEFVHLLAILDQNPGASWEELVGKVELKPESNPDLAPLDEDAPSDPASDAAGGGEDDLASFQL